jgi:hypothetical protein
MRAGGVGVQAIKPYLQVARLVTSSTLIIHLLGTITTALTSQAKGSKGMSNQGA